MERKVPKLSQCGSSKIRDSTRTNTETAPRKRYHATHQKKPNLSPAVFLIAEGPHVEKGNQSGRITAARAKTQELRKKLQVPRHCWFPSQPCATSWKRRKPGAEVGRKRNTFSIHRHFQPLSLLSFHGGPSLFLLRVVLLFSLVSGACFPYTKNASSSSAFGSIHPGAAFYCPPL